MKYNLIDFREFLPYELIEAPNHKGTEGYVCPCCGSGTHRGDKSTGAVSYFRGRDDGTLLWYCKACPHPRTRDIVDYVALKKKISKPDATKYVIQKYADRLESEATTEDHPQEVKPVTQTKPKQQVQPEPKSEHDPDKQQRQDYSKYFGKHYIYPRSVGDTYLQKKRGLTRETFLKYGLGYDSEIACRNSAGDIIDFGAIIIPFRNEESNTIPYFTARFIGKESERANVRYKNPPTSEAGELPIWNPSSLYAGKVCFVVEGIFDALSIIQVGGEAIALNGTSNSGKLIEVLRKRPTTSALVICLDNDGNEATAKSARELTERLQAMGISTVCDNSICGEHKDPNERLVSDPAGFKAAVHAKVEAFRAPKH